MIRPLETTDAPQLFDMMQRVYSTHSFLEQGEAAYAAQLETGSYVSLGIFKGDTLQAHAGYNVTPDYALMNALVVDPDNRSSGLGAEIFNARLQHIVDSGLFRFVIGYSMMQHIKSQRLYDDGFQPLGMDIGYPDIYQNADTVFNKGQASNAELVLCKRLTLGQETPTIPLAPAHQPLARTILAALDISPTFTDIAPTDQSFLGFHPTKTGDLYVPAYVAPTADVDFSQVVTSNQTRHNFVELIEAQHRA